MGFSVRDIGLFRRSARTDATLRRLQAQHGSRAAFDAVYAADPDPWASADPRYGYQRAKYDGIIGSLPPGRQFRAAIELGCGAGLLTERLAAVADHVTGIDIAQPPLDRAMLRPGRPANITYLQGDISDLPRRFVGQFDLVTIADALYYLPLPITDAVLAAVAERVAALLVPGGLCLLANHYVCRLEADSRLTLRIHASFAGWPGIARIARRRRIFYLVDLFARSA